MIGKNLKNIQKYNNIFSYFKDSKNFKFKILVFQKHISRSNPESGKSKKKIALPVINIFDYNIFFGLDLEHSLNYN